jgi:hypothetical protein
VALTLTILALALKVMVPPGFMIADHGSPFLITICTGHGPLVLNPSDHGRSKAPIQKKMDTPCTGAGNVTPPAPQMWTAISEPHALVADQTLAGSAVDLLPGRGLAAPPPPSQGPPLTLS